MATNGGSVFADTDAKFATEKLEEATPDHVKTIRMYIDGDHWQDGNGWIGPMPPADDPTALVVIASLEKGFTSTNKVAEVCERHAEGVTAREPRWALTPLVPLPVDAEGRPNEAAEQAMRAEVSLVEAWLSHWWNNLRIHENFLAAMTTLMWAERGVLRLYIPSAYLDGTLAPQFADIGDAMRVIYLDVPPPENSTVYVDPATKQQLGIFAYKDAEEKDVVEITFVEGDDPATATTIVRQMRGDVVEESDPMPWGGRIPMYEMTRARFITDPVLQNQRALNLALSTIPRNVTSAGFTERILTNAQTPGVWEVDPATNQRRKFIPGGFKVGAGTTQFIVGLEETDPTTGTTHYAPPGVHFREPSDPSPSDKAADAHYRRILEETDQSHVLMADDATASARSRVEARTDYLNSLKRTVPAAQAAGRWLLTTALAMAEALAGNIGTYTSKYRIDFECRVTVGQLTAEEREQNRADVAAELLPVEYAMSQNGIEDVDAALALIHAQSMQHLAMLEKRALILAALVNGMVPLDIAARMAGFDEDIVSELASVDPVTDPNTETEP